MAKLIAIEFERCFLSDIQRGRFYIFLLSPPIIEDYQEQKREWKAHAVSLERGRTGLGLA